MKRWRTASREHSLPPTLSRLESGALKRAAKDWARKHPSPFRRRSRREKWGRA